VTKNSAVFESRSSRFCFWIQLPCRVVPRPTGLENSNATLSVILRVLRGLRGEMVPKPAMIASSVHHEAREEHEGPVLPCRVASRPENPSPRNLLQAVNTFYFTTSVEVDGRLPPLPSSCPLDPRGSEKDQGSETKIAIPEKTLVPGIATFSSP